MRNKVAISGMLTLSAAMAAEMTPRGSVSTSRPKKPEPIKEPIPFKEQDGIKKMIQEYQLIRQGKSKKRTVKAKPYHQKD